MKPRRFLQGAGMAALVLFPVYATVIDGPSSLRMHSPARLTVYILSILANFALVAVVSAFLGGWILKNSTWNWLKPVLPGLVLASVAELIYITRSGRQSIPLWFWVLVAVTGLAVTSRWLWSRGENVLLRLSGATLIGFGFYCCFVVLQLLYLAAWRPSPNSTGQWQASVAQSSASVAQSADRADRPRVVWILFDELSYDQVFGHRYHDLQLPNFDRFRESSTLFTDAQPVVNETEEAVPSMLLGQRVSRVDFSYSNQVKVGIGKAPLKPFDPTHTSFAIARQDGLTTGVVGWYNPYCGMMTPYLNECYWTDEMLLPAVFENSGFWQDFFGSWTRYYERIFHRNRGSQAVVARIEAYRRLMHSADRLLRPSGPDFVLIHLPLPHPPGFYDRFTGQMDGSGTRSYIDNLALTDKTLGHILTVLRQSPRWSNTSVLVCGDHSWRVRMWSRGHFWTTEGHAASRDVFDPRPMLMVHAAGQTTAAEIDVPFSLLGVHTILDNLIAGKPPVFASAGKSNAVAR